MLYCACLCLACPLTPPPAGRCILMSSLVGHPCGSLPAVLRVRCGSGIYRIPDKETSRKGALTASCVDVLRPCVQNPRTEAPCILMCIACRGPAAKTSKFVHGSPYAPCRLLRNPCAPALVRGQHSSTGNMGKYC